MKGAPFKSSEFTDSGVPIVKVSDFEEESVSQDSCSYVDNKTASLYRNVQLEYGDILLSTVGSKPHVRGSMVGKAVKLPVSLHGALLNQNVVRLRADNNDITLDKFVFHTLKSHHYIEHIAIIAHGTANQASIDLTDLLDYPLCLPPISDQKQIATFLDQETARIDEVIENVRSQIEKLEEYRTVLISDAVTGRIDVRRFNES